MMKRFVDTNIFLRYLTKDDPSKYEKCKDIFRMVMAGKIALATSGMVIAELIVKNWWNRIQKPDDRI